MRDRLVSGGIWAFSGKVVTVISGLVLNLLLTHLLPPEDVGIYFLVFSLVSTGAIVAQLGLPQSAVRFVAESVSMKIPGRASYVVRTVLLFVFAGGIAVALLILLGGGEWVAIHLFGAPEMNRVLGMVTIWIVLVALQGAISEIFRGFGDIRYATLFGGAVSALISMAMFMMLWYSQGNTDLGLAILLMVAALAGSVSISLLILTRKVSWCSPEEEGLAVDDLLRVSFPLWVTGLTLFVLTQIDIWIMGVFSSQQEVALYGSAMRAVVLVAVPLLIVNAVVPPMIVELNTAGDQQKLENFLRMAAFIALLPSLLVTTVFLFYGEAILGGLFGAFYSEAASILALLSIGQLFNVWAGSCGLVLMLTGYQGTMMRLTLLSGLFTVSAALVLVARFGGAGVAAAISSGLVLQNLMMLFHVRKKLGIWTCARLRFAGAIPE